MLVGVMLVLRQETQAPIKHIQFSKSLLKGTGPKATSEGTVDSTHNSFNKKKSAKYSGAQRTLMCRRLEHMRFWSL